MGWKLFISVLHLLCEEISAETMTYTSPLKALGSLGFPSSSHPPIRGYLLESIRVVELGGTMFPKDLIKIK